MRRDEVAVHVVVPDQEAMRRKGSIEKKRREALLFHIIQDDNWSANVNAGPIPELMGACLINGEWEHDNSFQ